MLAQAAAFRFGEVLKRVQPANNAQMGGVHLPFSLNVCRPFAAVSARREQRMRTQAISTATFRRLAIDIMKELCPGDRWFYRSRHVAQHKMVGLHVLADRSPAPEAPPGARGARPSPPRPVL
jgi:hypothetical protein